MKQKSHSRTYLISPASLYKILGSVAEANIEVDMMIVQNAAKNGLTDFSFTVNRNDLDKAIRVIESEVSPYLEEDGILTDASIAKISCVGIGRYEKSCRCRS